MPSPIEFTAHESGFPGAGRGAAVAGNDDAVRQPGPAVRWSFLAFVVALPFESVPTGLPWKITTLAGGVFLLSTLLEPRLCWQRPPRAVWWFGAWLYIACAISLWNSGSHIDEAARVAYVLGQSLVLFWVSCNLMKSARTVRYSLGALASACVALALLQLAGITRTVVAAGSSQERLSALGQDPTAVAFTLSIGLLIVIAPFFRGDRLSPILCVPQAGAVLLIGMTIVRTGARGSLVALAAGLLGFLMAARNAWVWLRHLSLVALAFAALAVAATRIESVRVRFEAASRHRDLAGRERIYPAALAMLVERPWTGWGLAENTYEVGDRVRYPHEENMDTHNLGLYVLTATGLLGGTPFLVGFWLCGRAAFRARHGPEGLLPLAIFLDTLVVNMNVTGWYKVVWLLLAYCIASEAASSRRSEARDRPPAEPCASVR